MSIDKQLFKGKHIQLGPFDHERDPEIISRWTHDAGFMRMMYIEPARPLSPWQVKKQMEELEKRIEEKRNAYPFRIRTIKDERLVGIIELDGIAWSNGFGYLRLGIGAEKDRRKGYGGEAMTMLLRYAFDELNLFYLSAIIPEYNTPALGLFAGFGFGEEVRRRQALARDGQRWDLLNWGLLATEWKEKQNE